MSQATDNTERARAAVGVGTAAGILRFAQGDLAGAGRLYEQVLKVCRRVLGGEHLDTLRAMGNLAGTLCQQGDLEGARSLQEHVLKAMRRAHGWEHAETLMAMSNHAETPRGSGAGAAARGAGAAGHAASAG